MNTKKTYLPFIDNTKAFSNPIVSAILTTKYRHLRIKRAKLSHSQIKYEKSQIKQ